MTIEGQEIIRTVQDEAGLEDDQQLPPPHRSSRHLPVMEIDEQLRQGRAKRARQEAEDEVSDVEEEEP